MAAARRWRPDARSGVLLLVALMLASSAVAWLTALGGWPGTGVTPRVPWWALLPLFAVAEVVILNVQVRREAQAISLNEVPLVIGLLLAAPVDLLVAAAVGSGLAFVVHRRHTPVKALFNTALRIFAVTVMLTVFRFTAGPEPALDVVTAVATVAAVVVSGLVEGAVVIAVVALHDGGVSGRRMLRELVSYPFIPPAVSCIGLLAVLVLHADVRASVLLAVLVAGLFAAYRAYTSLTARHAGLSRMYDYGRALAQAPDLTSTVRVVLEGARDVLRAGTAEIVLVGGGAGDGTRHVLDGDDDVRTDPAPPGHRARWEDVLGGGGPLVVPRGRRRHPRLAELRLDEAVVVAMRDDVGVFGTLMVAQRHGETRTFHAGDAEALQAVANQAGLALRGARLVERLRHDALHDPLTGLANRIGFQRALDAAVRDGGGPAVLLVDLDGFKQVNDTLGHHCGDALLRHVAGTVTEAAGGESATVARLGGDEFAVVLPSTPTVAHARERAGAVERAIRRPVVLDGHEVTVRGSVGVALARPGEDTAALVRRADAAMYRAKEGGSGVRVDGEPDVPLPRPSPGPAPSPRSAPTGLVADLRWALVAGDLDVDVQPVASARSREVVAVEALARWRHPRLGVLLPHDFVALADRNGLAGDLTAVVLDRAAAAASSWREQGTELTVSVNVSAPALVDSRFAETVTDALDRHRIPPGRLVVEVTEAAVLSDPDGARAVLAHLRDSGIGVAVDDFGTGYSSLSQLSRIPAHQIKIDSSCIGSPLDDPVGLAVVRSIVDLGRNLSLEVVAEGVEDTGVWHRLASLGVDLVQGHVLTEPMPVGDLIPWLRGYRARTGASAAGTPLGEAPPGADGGRRLRVV